MLQLENHSPFNPAITVLPDENGIDTLYVIVKASFTFSGGVALAGQQNPPQMMDEFWGEPGQSSIKYASDMHLLKPATDIVLLGHAYAPDGKQVTQMNCGIKVGNYTKKVCVFGDRYWSGAQISQAEPFDRMPLIFENAYGGTYTSVEKNKAGEMIEKEVAHEVNPVGRGFCAPKRNACEGVKLPNLEDPAHLIRQAKDNPVPTGFGFVAPTWKPRIDYAGTYDDEWQRKRAPYLPTDFSNRFFSAASPGLTCNEYQKGSEPVVLVGVCPNGPAKFNLPEVDLKCQVSVAGRIEKPTLLLETIIFEPDKYEFSMTWRAALQCDKDILKVQAVRVTG